MWEMSMDRPILLFLWPAGEGGTGNMSAQFTGSILSKYGVSTIAVAHWWWETSLGTGTLLPVVCYYHSI